MSLREIADVEGALGQYATKAWLVSNRRTSQKAAAHLEEFRLLPPESTRKPMMSQIHAEADHGEKRRVFSFPACEVVFTSQLICKHFDASDAASEGLRSVYSDTKAIRSETIFGQIAFLCCSVDLAQDEVARQQAEKQLWGHVNEFFRLELGKDPEGTKAQQMEILRESAFRMFEHLAITYPGEKGLSLLDSKKEEYPYCGVTAARIFNAANKEHHWIPDAMPALWQTRLMPCHSCAEWKATLVCSGCKSVFYCNAEHSRQHWAQHKGQCKRFGVLLLRERAAHK